MRTGLIPSARGMRDIPPPAIGGWRLLEKTGAACFHRYGYGEIRTPIVERLDLFTRQLGEETDIVQKEMYAFADALNGDMLALRPEATAPTARALLSCGAGRGGIARVWYGGPMFRHERPQKGRYRQFHQMGAEALGGADPSLDAEQILMLARLWRELGIADRLQLDVNNLGDAAERARHGEKLRDHFSRCAERLDEDDKRRLRSNPLRLLDSKNPKLAEAIADAPSIADELGDKSRRFVDAVKNKIAAAGARFNENPALARGLDYYTLTVYEWSPVGDDRRQSVVCGGGRYDGLTAKIGGDALPGCGFALGMERTLDLMEEQAPPRPDCYLAIADDSCAAYADDVAESCRDGGIAVWRHVGGGALGRQLKKADAMRAPLALIVGGDENAGNYVTLKRLSDGQQQQAPAGEATATIRRMLGDD